ncbi:MAG: ATP-binding protein [Pseudomonadota bacterium]
MYRPDLINAPRAKSTIPWTVRLAVVALILLAGLIVWATDRILLNRFLETTRAEEATRLAIYTGDLESEMRQLKVVPHLLSRDPLLGQALKYDDHSQSSQRLIEFREEMSAERLLLVDSQGQIMASTDPQDLGEQRRNAPYVIVAMRSNQTMYSAQQSAHDEAEFYFSRRVTYENDPVGAVAVQVNLARIFRKWSNLDSALALIDRDGTVMIATEPRWNGLTLQRVQSGALAEPPQRLGIRMPLSDAAARAVEQGENVIEMTSDPFFEDWRLVSFTTVDDARARVNVVLAAEVTIFAVVLAVLFMAISRKADRRSANLARESDRLRSLNSRLQAEIAERERAERELQEAEQSLAQSSKMAALGEMATAVSHELNQPLAAMKTYLAGARLLMMRDRQNDALQSFDRMNELIDRMGKIARQLKAHARREEDGLSKVDLVQCLNTVIEMMAKDIERSAVNFTHTVPSDPLPVLAVAIRVEQVIVNLLRNAIDATVDQDHPTVHVHLAHVPDGGARLTVADNGHGIADMEALFEPFYTTKAAGDGLGLGLAISSGIIKSYGGRLTARNRERGGAIFTLDLPPVDDAGHVTDGALPREPSVMG